MKKNLLALGIGCLLTAGPRFDASASSKVVIRLGSVANENNIQHAAAERFADRVGQKTGGEVEVQLFFGGQLGKEEDMIDCLQMGAIQMMQSFPSKWAPYVPEIGALDIPFQFKDFAHVRKTTDGVVGQTLERRILEKTDVKVLKWWLHGFRHVYMKKPVRSAADMKGVKIRVPGIPVFVRTFELIGAVPVSVPWTELYTALQTGVVVACEADMDGAHTSKFYEVTDYVIKTGHIYTGSFLVIHDGFYQSLAPAHQKALLEAADETEQWLYTELVAKTRRDEAALSEKGMKIIEPDLVSFQTKLEPLVAEFLETVDAKDLLDEIERMTK